MKSSIISDMNLFLRMVFLGGLAAANLFVAGCASSVVDNTIFPRRGDSGAGNEHVAKFVVGDTVTVTLTGGPEEAGPETPHVEPIKEDGTITMPDIGHVQAAGKTAGELQNAIHDLYVPHFRTHITVTVSTGDRVYYVDGEVKSPGRQLYLGETTVTQAITSAGDFTDFADRHNIWLIRGKNRLQVDNDDIFKNPDTDPIVYPGDRIEVHRRWY